MRKILWINRSYLWHCKRCWTASWWSEYLFPLLSNALSTDNPSFKGTHWACFSMCFSSSIYQRCFFINLCVLCTLLVYHCLTDWGSPTGGVADVIRFFLINLNPHRERSLMEYLQDFDFIGLFLFVSGIVLFWLNTVENQVLICHNMIVYLV